MSFISLAVCQSLSCALGRKCQLSDSGIITRLLMGNYVKSLRSMSYYCVKTILWELHIKFEQKAKRCYKPPRETLNKK